MSRYLFDTSVLIDYLNRNDQAAVSHVEAVLDGSDSGCCSVVTEAELWTGIRNRRDELEVSALISKFESISLTSNIARLAGGLLIDKSEPEIRAHFGDALIAASAIHHGEIVLTADGASQRVFGNSVSYLVYR